MDSSVRFALTISFALGMLAACFDASQNACVEGSADCPCTSNEGCDPGLSCQEGVCIDGGTGTGSADDGPPPDMAETSGTGDGDGDTTTGDGDGDTTTTTGDGDGDTTTTTGGQCGNGVIDDGEQCDGANLGGFTCVDLGYSGGTLGCDPVTCTYDASNCTAGTTTNGTSGF